MDQFIEWVVEDGDVNWIAVIAVVAAIIWSAIMVYKFVAIKYNLLLLKWTENSYFSPWPVTGVVEHGNGLTPSLERRKVR